MKRSIQGFLLVLLEFGLLAAFCGCSMPPQDTPPATQATQAPAPVQTDASLTVDGVVIGPVFEVGETAYVNIQSVADFFVFAISEEDGALWLTAEGSDYTLRDGSDTAESPDGTGINLGGTALQGTDGWYLPVSSLELLLGQIPAGDDSCLNVRPVVLEVGQPCWFGGMQLTSTCRVDGVLCASLSALSDAAGGTLAENAGEWVLEAWDHRLALRPGNTLAEADGSTLTLTAPATRVGEDVFVSLVPVAEALGLRDLSTDDCVVYSRMLPCESVIWINGTKAETFTLPDGGVFVRLNEAAEALDGSFLPEENTAVLTAWSHELRFMGGSGELLADGESACLRSPAVADGAMWYAPAADLLPALGLTEMQDPDLDQLYYTKIVRHDEIPIGYRVPVLMYHAVSDDTWGIEGLFASPSVLEQQIQAMLEAGYTPITFEDLDRIDEIEKPVILTFDDGYDDNYTELFPLLQKYNVKATVFMIVNDIGKNHKLTLEQIQEMSSSGLVSFQSHTMSHSSLAILDESQLRYEHNDSVLGLARITGKQPFVLCYPAGKSTDYSRLITSRYYEFGINMTGPCYITGNDPYQVCRYYILRDTSVETFLKYLAG